MTLIISNLLYVFPTHAEDTQIIDNTTEVPIEDTGIINVNLDWVDGNPNNKNLTLYVCYGSTGEPVDDDDDVIIAMVADDYTADSTFTGSSKPIYHKIYKEIQVPSGTTNLPIEVGISKDKETYYSVYVEKDDLNYNVSTGIVSATEIDGEKYFNSTGSNSFIDNKKLSIVRFRPGKKTYNKNIILSPQNKKKITFTNKIVGGDREYTEYILNPSYYMLDAKTAYMLAIIQNTTKRSNVQQQGDKTALITLLDKDEKSSSEYLISQLKYFFQLSVPAYSNPDKNFKTLEATISQLSKYNAIDSYMLLNYNKKEPKTNVIFNKVDENGTNLTGASFELYDQSKNKIEEWSEETKEIELSNGTYVLKETNTPEGYKKIDEVEFTVNNIENETLQVINEYTDNFFLNDEKNIEEVQKLFANVLEEDNNKTEDAKQYVKELQQKIDNLDVSKNDIKLIKVLNTMQPWYLLNLVRNEKPEEFRKYFTSIEELKEEYYNSTVEALNFTGMEELIPYLDNSKSIIPVIKLKNNETITINDPKINEEGYDFALFLYGRNYEDEGYEVNNRSTLLNNNLGALDYVTTYTYTGEKGGKQIISSDDSNISIDKQTINITNKKVDTLSVKGQKIWNDNNNQDGIRPDKITVNLLADGKFIDKKEVSASTNWIYEFENLPKTNSSGTEIKYSVQEVQIPKYETSIDGYNITNTHIPEKVTLNGQKIWDDDNNNDGKRPSSIKVNLLANGEKVDSIDVSDDWAYEFKNLPKYKDGAEIVYTVTEEPVDKYVTTIKGYDVTNTYTPEKVTISGIKTWNDGDDVDKIRPKEITVNLFADGEKIDTVKVSDETEWKYSFNDLLKYKNGKEIEYTISEDEVKGYETKIEGYNITNIHVPKEPEKPGKPVTPTPSKVKEPKNPTTPTPPVEKPKKLTPSTSVETGDNSNLLFFSIVFVVVLVGVVVLVVKRRKK